MAVRFINKLVNYILPLQFLFASTRHSQQSKTTVHLILDWDGTLTKQDTLHIVAQIGYSHNRDQNLTPWDEIVQAYLSDYDHHEAVYKPVRKERKRIAEESEWLASLIDVERESIKRVQAAGVFAGVTKQDVSSASKSAIIDRRIELRNGWRELLSIAFDKGDQASMSSPVSVISVNWSRTFIRTCLETALQKTSGSEVDIDTIPICANEIYPDVEDKSTIYTSADKLAAFQKLRGAGSRPTLYVGDTSTDFDCLVAADVGICVRNEIMSGGQKELKDTLERVGFELARLSPTAWTGIGQGSKNNSDFEIRENRRVWWVTDLMEIVRFIEES
ncbi:MAG: hypothetical protein M1821_002601 [Bathelium mastoideum]|nr:MAG: hypothetical protein M1821_002601 [Bathelium mastoideum]